MASSRVADVVVLSRPARMANRLNQAAQRRIFDAVACHHKLHQRVVKELGQVQLGKVHMHGDPPLAWAQSQLALEFPRICRGQSAYGVAGSVTSGTGVSGPMFTRPGSPPALPSSTIAARRCASMLRKVA